MTLWLTLRHTWVYSLHSIQDIEDICLILEGWTMLKLLNQIGEICVPLSITRQMQVHAISLKVRFADKYTHKYECNTNKTIKPKIVLVYVIVRAILRKLALAWWEARCCGTSSRFRDFLCLLMMGATGKYMDGSEKHKGCQWHINSVKLYTTLLGLLGMLWPWTWAMKDRMSLVVCSALKTWCCPLWIGGRWNFVEVLCRRSVRYCSNMSPEPPTGKKHNLL